MNILLTGANGFIGRYLFANLTTAGHNVIPAIRHRNETDDRLSQGRSIAIDFNRDTRPEDWMPRLAGIDAVINCAGILQKRIGQSIEAIHADAPKALFTACQNAGVKRVIQISAISAEEGAGTAYASTKRVADSFLTSTELEWVILRPSLIYAAGASGGTALFRALAALPFVIPVIGKGEQPFQPIYIDDLSATVLRILDLPAIRRVIIDPVGPEIITLRQLLIDLRRWLGLPPGRIIEIPISLVRIAALMGNILGGPINSTAIQQLVFGNAGNSAKFIETTDIQPRRWSDVLSAHPSQVQDHWHARLYFLRPILRWALALMWMVSGIVGLGRPPGITSQAFAAFGLSGVAASAVIWASCLFDIGISALLLIRWRPRWIALIQIAVVSAYTIELTYAEPSLWTDPFGPLLKNIPIVIAILILGTIESDR